MASEERASGVLINSGLVREEVFVDVEGGFDWAVLEDFTLDGSRVRADSVS